MNKLVNQSTEYRLKEQTEDYGILINGDSVMGGLISKMGLNNIWS